MPSDDEKKRELETVTVTAPQTAEASAPKAPPPPPPPSKAGGAAVSPTTKTPAAEGSKSDLLAQIQGTKLKSAQPAEVKPAEQGGLVGGLSAVIDQKAKQSGKASVDPKNDFEQDWGDDDVKDNKDNKASAGVAAAPAAPQKPSAPTPPAAPPPASPIGKLPGVSASISGPDPSLFNLLAGALGKRREAVAPSAASPPVSKGDEKDVEATPPAPPPRAPAAGKQQPESQPLSKYTTLTEAEVDEFIEKNKDNSGPIYGGSERERNKAETNAPAATTPTTTTQAPAPATASTPATATAGEEQPPEPPPRNVTPEEVEANVAQFKAEDAARKEAAAASEIKDPVYGPAPEPPPRKESLGGGGDMAGGVGEMAELADGKDMAGLAGGGDMAGLAGAGDVAPGVPGQASVESGIDAGTATFAWLDAADKIDQNKEKGIEPTADELSQEAELKTKAVQEGGEFAVIAGALAATAEAGGEGEQAAAKLTEVTDSLGINKMMAEQIKPLVEPFLDQLKQFYAQIPPELKQGFQDAMTAGGGFKKAFKALESGDVQQAMDGVNEVMNGVKGLSSTAQNLQTGGQAPAAPPATATATTPTAPAADVPPATASSTTPPAPPPRNVTPEEVQANVARFKAEDEAKQASSPEGAPPAPPPRDPPTTSAGPAPATASSTTPPAPEADAPAVTTASSTTPPAPEADASEADAPAATTASSTTPPAPAVDAPAPAAASTTKPSFGKDLLESTGNAFQDAQKHEDPGEQLGAMFAAAIGAFFKALFGGLSSVMPSLGVNLSGFIGGFGNKATAQLENAQAPASGPAVNADVGVGASVSTPLMQATVPGLEASVSAPAPVAVDAKLGADATAQTPAPATAAGVSAAASDIDAQVGAPVTEEAAEADMYEENIVEADNKQDEENKELEGVALSVEADPIEDIHLLFEQSAPAPAINLTLGANADENKQPEAVNEENEVLGDMPVTGNEEVSGEESAPATPEPGLIEGLATGLASVGMQGPAIAVGVDVNGPAANNAAPEAEGEFNSELLGMLNRLTGDLEQGAEKSMDVDAALNVGGPSVTSSHDTKRKAIDGIKPTQPAAGTGGPAPAAPDAATAPPTPPAAEKKTSLK